MYLARVCPATRQVKGWLLFVIGLVLMPTTVAEISKLIRNRSEAAEYKGRLEQHTPGSGE